MEWRKLLWTINRKTDTSGRSPLTSVSRIQGPPSNLAQERTCAKKMNTHFKHIMEKNLMAGPGIEHEPSWSVSNDLTPQSSGRAKGT